MVVLPAARVVIPDAAPAATKEDIATDQPESDGN